MTWTPETLAPWYATPAGSKVARAVVAAVQGVEDARWVGALRPLLLEVGYAAPYRACWPTALADAVLPPALGEDNYMECRYDRVVLAHALEDLAADAAELLTRCAQALRPDGLLMVVVPASFALCRLGKGPFAAGRCFTAGKLQAVLMEAGFKPRAVLRVAGVIVALASRTVGGTRVLVHKPVGGKVSTMPAGITTLRGL
ncbi:MAG: hypothetical protein WAZ18_01640 [Alphaproteobacteria bacterium]